MEATATAGVWCETILPGIVMTCNTNIDLISVSNQHGNNITYRCEDGITTDDVEQIRNSILKSTYKSTMVGDIRIEA
jgi:hypothetical protein